MADTQVKDETFLNELDLDGDERLYAVDDPVGTPADRYIDARAMFNPFRNGNRIWGCAYAPSYTSTIATIGFLATTLGTTGGETVSYNTATERQRRRRIATSTGTTAGVGAGRRANEFQLARGDAAGRQGYRVLHRFAYATLTATYRTFVGIYNQTTPGNTDPSTWTGLIGFGKDAADTGYFIIHNDGSGAATKIAIDTTDFPINDTSSVYELELYCPPGNLSNVTWKLRRINGVDANGRDTYAATASGTLSTNLPPANDLSGYIQWLNNDVNAAAAVLNTMMMYFEAYGG